MPPSFKMRFVTVLLIAIAQVSLGAPAAPDQASVGPCPYDDCLDLINSSACYNGAVSRKDKKALFECVPEGQKYVSRPTKSRGRRLMVQGLQLLGLRSKSHQFRCGQSRPLPCAVKFISHLDVYIGRDNDGDGDFDQRSERHLISFGAPALLQIM